MFAYRGNTPVIREDNGGRFGDTVFDVVSLAFSVVDVIANPEDPLAWIGLAGDAIDLIPFVTGVGETVRVVSTVIDIADAVHDIDNGIDAADTIYDGYKAVSNIGDAGKVLDNAGDTFELAGDVSRKVDFYVTPNGEAIPATLDGFNDNLSKLNLKNGKYYGSDSVGPIRIRANEIHLDNPNFTGIRSQYHSIPHFHIERKAKIISGDWIRTYTGAMEMFTK